MKKGKLGGGSRSPLWKTPIKVPIVPLTAIPGDENIAELEERLEMFLLSLSEPLEPCVWACGCFLTHGRE